MRRFIVIACAPVAAACLFLWAGAPARADVVFDGGGEFVNLFAVEASKAGVAFVAREPSGRCGITYHVERFGESPALLALIRDTEGHRCKGKLRIYGRVAFSYEELELEIGERFQVLNSIEANSLSLSVFRGASVELNHRFQTER